MGIKQMGPPAELVKRLKEVFNADCFIETGTYKGATSIWASAEFEKVITIENSLPIYKETSARLADLKNTQFVFGHTTEKLKELVPLLTAPAIFWLDAHWSGGETYGSTDECPVLEEIEIIYTSAYPHCVLIDDARLFTAPPPPPHNSKSWPDITKLLAAINAKGARYTIIFDDVIISVPLAAEEIVREYCRSANELPTPLEMMKRGLRMLTDGFGAYFKK
jgi:hypothetical protein